MPCKAIISSIANDCCQQIIQMIALAGLYLTNMLKVL